MWPANVWDQQQLEKHQGLNRFSAAHTAWALLSTQALLFCLWCLVLTLDEGGFGLKST